MKDTNQEKIITKLYDMGLHQLFRDLDIKYVETGKTHVQFEYKGYNYKLEIK